MKTNEWIKTDDELPELGTTVDIVYQGVRFPYCIFDGAFIIESGDKYKAVKPSHWMRVELPEQE